MTHPQPTWFRAGDPNMLAVGRLTTVQAGHHTLALTRTEKGYGAISNRCPHQGGPLGDGFLQDGWLLCPWHAWEYDPHTGATPPEYDDPPVPCYPVEVRDDGVYVGVIEPEHQPTLMTQMVDVMLAWGVDTIFGMVGHSNLGLADAFYLAEKAGRLRYIGIRHEGAAAFAASGYAKLTGRPAACFAIAGPGATNLLTGLWDAKVDRAPVLALTGQVNTQVLGPGAFQEVPLDKAFDAVAAWSQTVLRPENAVIAVDVGNNTYSFGMYFESKRQDVIMSGYLGSIGFAFPAAMGAWAAAPDRKIMAIAGDGGFGQYLAEFTTAVKYGMPITLVLLNNSELAKISREQRGGNYHVWQTGLHNPNFARYAENCGGLGIRVEKAEELRPALERAFAYPAGPSLVEIISSAGQL
ncbi:MAG: thiamine pyrophosphate-dependent enzyme [Anaerolineales bacterium]